MAHGENYSEDACNLAMQVAMYCIVYNSYSYALPVSMSKDWNSTPASANSDTMLLLKPHLGSLGLPFINSMTVAWFIRALSRSSREGAAGGSCTKSDISS